MALERYNNPLQNIWNALQALSATLASWGPWGILLLGFIDSAGIPVAVAMDAIIVLLAVNAPERAWLGAAMGVVGSLGGNLLLFLAARKGGERFLERAPAGGRAHRLRRWFDSYGMATVFIPALVPIPLPLKVFVVLAGVLGTSLRTFLLVVLAARTMRYFGLAWLGVLLGREAEGFLKAHAWTLAGIAALLFAAIYGLLKLAERKS